MRPRTICNAIAAGLVCLLVGCGAPHQGHALHHRFFVNFGPLPGTQWIVDRIDGKPPPPGRIVWLTFDQDRVGAGGAACNTFSADYDTTPISLRTSTAEDSALACFGFGGRTEAFGEGALGNLVASLRGFRQPSADHLTLLAAGGHVGELHRKPPPIYDIQGLWRYCGRGSSDFASERSSLVSFDRGAVTEGSGCRGAYSVAGGDTLKLTFRDDEACRHTGDYWNRGESGFGPGRDLNVGILPAHSPVRFAFEKGASDLRTNLADRLVLSAPNGGSFRMCRIPDGPGSPRAEDLQPISPVLTLDGTWAAMATGEPIPFDALLQFDRGGRFWIGTACEGRYEVRGDTLRLHPTHPAKCVAETAAQASNGLHAAKPLSLGPITIRYQGYRDATLVQADGAETMIRRLDPWELREHAYYHLPERLQYPRTSDRGATLNRSR
jgi:hypothetical protein